MSVLRSTSTLLVAAALLVACSDDSVTPGAELTLTVTPTSLTIEQGTTGESDITVVREGTDEEVSVTVTGGGTGVTGSIEDVVHDGDETTAMLSIDVTEGAEAGTYIFTVSADNDDADAVTTQVNVTVTEAQGQESD